MRTPRVILILLCLGFAPLLSLRADAALAEITRAEAVFRVRSILRNNTGKCRINRINSVTAVKARVGWRVTAKIVMSASGRALSETAVWNVSAAQGATPQNQLTAELSIGCLN